MWDYNVTITNYLKRIGLNLNFVLQVSDLYKRHALGQLKKEFRHTAVNAINKVFADNAGKLLKHPAEVLAQ